MGHYRAEMVCNKCGHALCACPRKPEKKQWAVNYEFLPLDISTENLLSFLSLKNGLRPFHDTYEEAEKTVPGLIRDKISQLEHEIILLEMRLDFIQTGLANL